MKSKKESNLMRDYKISFTSGEQYQKKSEMTSSLVYLENSLLEKGLEEDKYRKFAQWHSVECFKYYTIELEYNSVGNENQDLQIRFCNVVFK